MRKLARPYLKRCLICQKLSLSYTLKVRNIVWITLSFFFIFSATAADKLCPGVILHGADLNLAATERRLLCGDKMLKAYKDIPAYQARFFFKGFLQSRGYLNPHFDIIDDVLHVYPGDKQQVKSIVIQSEDTKVSNDIEDEIQRLYQDKILSTKVLDQVEEKALEELSYRGYPCAKVSSEAFIENGEVRVSVEDLKSFEFGQIEKEKIEGLHRNALDRYYPFHAGDIFDDRLLELTQKRMTRAGVIQGTYFLQSCTENDFSLSQKFIIGPPRTLRFGVGASTELGTFARIRWANNRYKSMASVLSAFAQVSFRFQTLTLSADSFFWNHAPRRSLFSQIEFIRESQFEYEQSLLRAKPHLKWTRDSEGYYKTYSIGPSYEAGVYRSQTKATRSFSTGILEGGLNWTSHTYEFFDFHPQEGQIYRLNFDFRHPAFGFTDPLLKADSSFLHLGRLTDWGRGTLVGGLRLNLGTSWIKNSVVLRDLPPTVKFYGGGNDDVRGFNLNTLPQNQGLGALTRISFKAELRRTYFIREYFEIFSFLDGAYFGENSWDLDPPFYYSPGLGLRWLSPFGLVQSYAARSFRTKPFNDEGVFLFAGIGGLF